MRNAMKDALAKKRQGLSVNIILGGENSPALGHSIPGAQSENIQSKDQEDEKKKTGLAPSVPGDKEEQLIAMLQDMEAKEKPGDQIQGAPSAQEAPQSGHEPMPEMPMDHGYQGKPRSLFERAVMEGKKPK